MADIPFSRNSLLPHWTSEIYSKFAAPFYNKVTTITGWRRMLIRYALEGLEPGLLLDVGCGTGLVLKQAKHLGFSAVGIDPSTGMLLRAPNKLALVAASADSLPFRNGSFDIVLASGSLVHIASVEAAVREICRVVSPGGRIRILDHADPIRKTALTGFARIFSQLSGDIIHDYEALFAAHCTLLNRSTIGRGGLLQCFDFRKTA